MSILSSTLTYSIPSPSLSGSVSKSNKIFPLSTGISRRANHNNHLRDMKTRRCAAKLGNTLKTIEITQTYNHTCLCRKPMEKITLIAQSVRRLHWRPETPKVLHDNEAVDNQEDIKDVWIFFNRNVGREFFIFCSQLIFVFVSVVFCTLRMLIVSSLTCEERTAYTMILSNCIAYLLPNANSFRKTFD